MGSPMRSFFLDAQGQRLEAVWYGPAPEQAPTLVFLHEGLGSVSLWKDFPQALAERTGLGALVYSRLGYGKSDPTPLPRPLDYMQREARESLPEVLRQAGVRDFILVGHSDGASIALAYAGGAPSPGLRGLILEAPHVFCEDVSVRSIAAARDAYTSGDLRERLKRHHGENVDVAFWGWNRAWLDPDFRQWNIEAFLPNIRVPALILQGEDDEYGTRAQVDAIVRQSGAPVEVRMLPECGHSPHRDQRDAVLEAMARFAQEQLR